MATPCKCNKPRGEGFFSSFFCLKQEDVMKLVIAEKPSVVLNLAKVLGARKKKDGYVEGSG